MRADPMLFTPYTPPSSDGPRTSVKEALDQVLAAGNYSLSSERVPLEEGLGRVAAETVLARHSLPPTCSSQVDGVAIRFDDLACRSSWREGSDLVFVGTGMALPEGFDTVVRVEDLEVCPDGRIEMGTGPMERGAYTVPCGWEVQIGEPLVPGHLRLEPHHLGLLAAGGHREVPVLRRPLVAVLPTGSELVPPGTTPGPGQNVDSNSVFFAAYLRSVGAEPLSYPITEDDPSLLKERLRDALSRVDMVLVNGGSSRGRADFTVPVVTELGKVLVHGLNSAPGKPLFLAVAEGKPIVGVPGPALAAWYGLEHFVGPMVAHFLAQPPAQRATVRGRLTRTLQVEGFLREALLSLRASLSLDDEGRYLVSPFPLKNSMVTNFVDADAILRVPEGVAGYERGDEVEVLLLYPEAVIARRFGRTPSKASASL